MSVKAANYAIRFCGLQDVAAKMVLTALAWQARKETPHFAHMSNEDIRRHTGLKSINGVKDALRRLVDAGEIRVREIGGRTYGIGRAADFELLGVKRWIESGEPSESDSFEQDEPSESDGKVSAFDGKPSESDEKPSASDTHRQRHSKTTRQSADAPATATTSPSLPSSSEKTYKPRKPSTPAFDPASIPLPHGPGFQKWWLHFVEHRASPIKGRRNPLTPLAAKIILGELSAVNEQQAVESIKKCIAAGWVKPFPPEPPQKPTIVELPPQGRPKQTALERSLEEMRRQYGKEDAA
jgi:hypothetical protein